jgi:hypothetical protein
VRGLGASGLLFLGLLAPALAQEDGSGEQQPGFLGVSMAEWAVPDSDPPQAVVRVSGVVPGSAAEAAGVEPDDLILAVDGLSTAAAPGEVLQAFAERIRGRHAGSRVELQLRRRTVTVRTYLDEDAAQPAGPPVDASGRGALAILPDLAELLESHHGGQVTLRARSYDRERSLVVVLGVRPTVTREPLPPNASLRPDLEASSLGRGAALAQEVIARGSVDEEPLSETQAELVRRLEENEQGQDPYRLQTVRYLHRDPLRLEGATRDLSGELRGLLGHSSRVATLLEVAARNLDAVGPVDSAVLPTAPEVGSTVSAYVSYLTDSARLAHSRVELALADLNEEERQHLVENLPTMADQFAEHIYLYEDPDPERWARHQRAVQLMARVHRRALLEAAAALAPFADPELLDQMRMDLQAAEARGEYYQGGVPATSGRFLWHSRDPLLGEIVIGSSDDNMYRLEADLLIDLGGDDRYHQPVGGATPEHPVRLAIDLGGDDRYQTTAPYAFGAGFLGVGMLVDTQGDDCYTSHVGFSQGAALCGVGLLVDLAGRDTYRAPLYTQGAALCQGLAGLLDVGGDDDLRAGLFGQGFAGPAAFGVLLSLGGDDRYAAVGHTPCGYGDAGTYRAMSQGASVGFRQVASGGIAVLLDEGGSDRYEAGNFSQGGGYYYGWGLLADLGPEGDLYEGSRYAQGFAAHSALGSLWDEAGDDRYRSWVGASLSAAWDLSVTVFLDDAGDDRYQPGPGFSLGASAHNGFSLFVDRAGNDHYALGPARAGPNDYHGGPSVSVFLDAGGQQDVYAGGGLRDQAAALHPRSGVALDLKGPLESADLAPLLAQPQPEEGDR